MKATEMPWGQVNSALFKLVQSLGGDADKIIAKINTQGTLPTGVGVYLRWKCGWTIPQDVTADMRENQRRGPRIKCGYTLELFCKALEGRRAEEGDPYPHFATIDYFLWECEGGPLPRDIIRVARQLQTTPEALLLL